jgi:hypothetical protein
MLIGGKFHSTSQTHKGEEEKKCEEKYKNIKNGVKRGFCSPKCGVKFDKPEMERGIKSLMKFAFCRI